MENGMKKNLDAYAKTDMNGKTGNICVFKKMIESDWQSYLTLSFLNQFYIVLNINTLSSILYQVANNFSIKNTFLFIEEI